VPGAAPSAVGQVAKDLIEGNHAELSPAGDSPRGLAIAQKQISPSASGPTLSGEFLQRDLPTSEV
jgi:hypothetical protein